MEKKEISNGLPEDAYAITTHHYNCCKCQWGRGKGEGQLCDSAAKISNQFEYQMECLHGYEMLLRVSN